MMDALQAILRRDDNVRYALLFGSAAHGRLHAGSDVDVAVGFSRRPTVQELGELIAALELAVGRAVDLVDLADAPPSLSWRIFREGAELLVLDREALVERKARAISAYLDWKPVEERLVGGVLHRAAHG